jgi:uncharacterized delta-60 repeat protein
MIIRYTSNGDLDTAFGSNGIVVADFSNDESVNALALQPDGKIVAGGSNILARFNGNSASGVFNYDPNGQFDYLAAGEVVTDTFTYIATNGVLTDTATVSITVTGVDDAPIAVNDSGPAFTTYEDTAFLTGDVLANDIDPEGQPLSVQSIDTSSTLGQVTWGSGGQAGNLDTEGFGAPEGYVPVDFGNPSSVNRVAIQPDQKIVVTGIVDNLGNYDFGLSRYNTDGSLDQAFGNAGIVTTDFANNYDEALAITVQPDGMAILAGVTNGTNGADFALARYTPDGSLDDSFGNEGKVTTDFGNNDYIKDLAVRPDGKIVVIAEMTNGNNDDFALVQYNPDGSLDTTFGTGGLVMTDFGQWEFARAVVIHNDQIVVVGEIMGAMGDNANYALARYNLDGSLDTTFGNSGLVITDFTGGFDSAQDVAIQPNGLIVAAGTIDVDAGYNFGLARYNLDGSLDPSFGNAGLVITDLGDSDGIVGVVIQPNGQIVAGGYTFIDSFEVFALARYNPDGSLDNEYGNGGIATANIGNNSPRSMAIQLDSKIVMSGSGILARFLGNSSNGIFNYDPNGQFETLAAGELSYDTFTYVVSDGTLTDTATVMIDIVGVNDPPAATDDRGPGFTTDEDTPFITGNVVANDQDTDGDPLSVSGFDASGTHGLVTFNGGGGGPAGSLDVDTFNAPYGFVTTDLGGYEEARDVAIQPDGKIVAVGTFHDGFSYNFTVMRHEPDGFMDASFGYAGIVTTDLFGENDYAYAVAIQADGKIIVVGGTDTYSGFALARYNPDGSLDTTFDGDGIVTTDFGGYDVGYDVAVQPDGQIVVAGTSEGDFAIARYNPDGSLDTTFDSDGKVTTDLYGENDYCFALSLAPAGKIVLAGNTILAGYYDFALARYNPDGSLDTTFDGDGKVTTDFGSHEFASAVAIQGNGQILAAGRMETGLDIYDFALARYNTDGSLDTTFSTDGRVTTDFGSDDSCSGVAIQADGKIILAGYAYNNTLYNVDFALARYNPDGSLDASFGLDGLVTTDFNNSNDMGYALAMQPDGKVVLVGSTYDQSSYLDFVVARYNGDGGTFTYDPNGQFDYLQAGETATDTFTYVVTDGVLTDTAVVSITILGTGLNNPPFFTSTPVTTAVSTLPYTYTITVDDPDASDILTVTAPILPAWLTLADHGDRTAALSGTPDTPGSYPIFLAVSDGISYTTQAFTITVTPIPANPVADLSITQSFPWLSQINGMIVLVVSNLGPDDAPGTIVSDTFPLNFDIVFWSCTGSGGATCTANGEGNIYDTLTSFPAGGVVTYTISVGSILLGDWENTAVVLVPAGISDPDMANNRATYEIFHVLLPVIFRQYPTGSQPVR